MMMCCRSGRALWPSQASQADAPASRSSCSLVRDQMAPPPASDGAMMSTRDKPAVAGGSSDSCTGDGALSGGGLRLRGNWEGEADGEVAAVVRRRAPCCAGRPGGPARSPERFDPLTLSPP